MKHKIGFSAKTQSPPAVRPASQTQSVPPEPRKSLVQVFFPERNMKLTYFNDQFDLHIGDIVYVDGKLEGLRGRVADVSYSFRIKLSDYKRVIAAADTCVSGKLHMAGSHMASFDPGVIPYEKIIRWFKAPEAEDELYVSGSDGKRFPLHDLSKMGLSGPVAERGQHYYAENRVVYLCLDNGRGRGIAEGASPYELTFSYGGGAVWDLTCSCYCSYPCKHTAAAMLQLRETLELLKKERLFDWEADGYMAAISKSALFSFAVDGKVSGSIQFR